MEVQIDAGAPSGGRARPLRLAMLGDERLARLVGGGSERAFTALYERYHQPLYRYCRSMLRNDADAQDALQSTFAGALVALRGARREAPLRPWLFRIAHNESISVLRRRRPENELTEAAAPLTASVEEVAEQRARLALLLADLRELPERQRGALVMRELSGLSHQDVALALGISVGAAKQTVFEARQSLAEFSEGRAVECEEIRRIVSDGDRRALRSRRVRGHLRECSACTAFAAAIPLRTADLRALAPPLPAVAAAGMLARLMQVGGGGAGSGGTGGAAAATVGKSAGLALSTKAVTGVALIATTVVGVSTVLHHATHVSRASSSAPAALTRLGSASRTKTAPSSGGSRGAVAGRGHPARPNKTSARPRRRASPAARRSRARAAARPRPAAAVRSTEPQARPVTAVRRRPSRGADPGERAHREHRQPKPRKPDAGKRRRGEREQSDPARRRRAKRENADAVGHRRPNREHRSGGAF